MKTAGAYHKPVLLIQSIDLLNVREDGIYVDVTFGGGGHCAEILKRLTTGRIYAFDKDKDAIQNSILDERVELINSDFKFIENQLLQRGVSEVDGIIGDLGISSHQIDAGERGFSFRYESKLDMRMDQEQEISAWEVLNEYPEQSLKQIFWRYGELKQSGRLARLILTLRQNQEMNTTRDLENAVAQVVPAKQRKKALSQVFQAVRIEVNQELKALEALLEDGLKLLRIGGRMSIISYHSLEDRMVKRFFRYGNLAGKDERDLYGNPLSPLKPVTRKVIMPSEEEISNNPRARSARLRAAEKIK